MNYEDLNLLYLQPICNVAQEPTKCNGFSDCCQVDVDDRGQSLETVMRKSERKVNKQVYTHLTLEIMHAMISS